MIKGRRAVFGFGLALTLAAADHATAAPVVFSAGGDATTGSILGTVDDFRNAIGGANNGNAPGPIAGGRREINWDGGGSTVAAPTPAVFTGFTNTRGATNITPGTGFLQTPLDAPELAAINPTYAATFSAFSPVRIFVPVASNITDVVFSEPGTAGAVQATVAGFGAVFSDVDLADTTTIEYFDLADSSLGSFAVTPGTVADGSLSFLGVLFTTERVARVRITTGNVALGPNDDPTAGVDVVAMDDFLYAEPVAVPEPSSLALMGIAGLVLVGARRRFRPAA